MKKFLCLLLSALMLLCVGCDTSSDRNPPTATTTLPDYKNDPINKWEPWKLPDEIQKDLVEIEGEVIAFKRLGFLRERNNFMLISNAGQIDTIQGNELFGASPWTSPYGCGDDPLSQTRESWISQLQNIDFETYYLLVCPVKYSSSDFGFEGEPLLQLMKRDNKLYYIVQSDWGGGMKTDDTCYNTFFLLVKKSDLTLGEDTSAEVLVYNKNHKDVGACYYSSKSVFK